MRLAVLLAVAGLALTALDNGHAVVVRARLVPFTMPDGKAAQMVLTDWKNTGNTSLKSVFADIKPFDSKGRLLESGVGDYCIFAVVKDSEAIKPGKVYREPQGKGFVLMPRYGKAAKVVVKVTRVR